MIKITKKMLGLKKSPRDNRDFLLSSVLGVDALPEEVDRTKEMTPVRDQKNEGSCAGFAAVSVKEYQEQKDYSRLITLSPRYIYEYAKKISGHDSGTTISAVMIILRSCGICEERFWPYVPNDVGKCKKGVETNARKYKVKAYWRIRNIEELKGAIAKDEIGVAEIGVKVYSGMMSDECRRTGIVPDPTCWERGQSRGGHALTACSFQNNSPYFDDGHIKVKNSWGKAFGDEGYLYLSYNYIRNNMLDSYGCLDINDPDKYRIEKLGDKPEWEKK